MPDGLLGWREQKLLQKSRDVPVSEQRDQAGLIPFFCFGLEPAAGPGYSDPAEQRRQRSSLMQQTKQVGFLRTEFILLLRE